MKLDAANLKYLSRDDWRVLTALEVASRNHEIVPVALVAALSGLTASTSAKSLSTLLRHKLIAHDRSLYDGYRLTYPGFDFLALKALLSRGVICGVGRQIGVGKESDIYLGINNDGETVVLKFERLGRVSFRAIKAKRDYLQHRKSANWLYMSRLAALKEFAFMTALHDAGFPTPRPIDCNRHVIAMSVAPGTNLSHVRDIGIPPSTLFDELMQLVSRLASCGLVHCDFNEFNIMVVPETGQVTMIDFPQMVSTSHPNAAEMFDRDVRCLRIFFHRRFGYTAGRYPSFEAVAVFSDSVGKSGDAPKGTALDVAVEASGVFSSKHARDLELMIREQHRAAEGDEEGGSDAGEDEDDGEYGRDEDVATDGAAPDATATAAAGDEFVRIDSEAMKDKHDDLEATDVAHTTVYEPAAGGEIGEGSADESGSAHDDDAESEEEDEESEEDPELKAIRRRQAAEEEARKFDRPPEGVRSRAGGARIRAPGGEAYLRKKKETAAAAEDEVVPGITRDEIRHKVKRQLDKRSRHAEFIAASAAAKGGNRSKDRERAKVHDMLKHGEY